MRILAYRDRFLEDARRSFRYVKNDVRFLSFVGVFTLPGFAFFDSLIGGGYFETFWIRVSGAAVLVPYIVKRPWRLGFLNQLPIYWVACITYVFPFVFGHMLLVNAALTPIGEQLGVFWILQYFVALFLFVQLSNSALIATVGWLVSVAALFGCVLVLGVVNWVEIQRVFFYELTAFLTTVIIGSWINRNVELVQAERVDAIRAIGGNIAHELRTPLLAIQLRAQALEKWLPPLLQNYERTGRVNDAMPKISAKQMRHLRGVGSDLVAETRYAHTVIDMLLANTSDDPFLGIDEESFDVSAVLEEALGRYPYANDTERDLLQLSHNAGVVRICAPRMLVVHVLLNLVKNAVFFSQKCESGQPHVAISYGIEADGGCAIRIHDNGPGVPADAKERIFERFYTTSERGVASGIGLSFCRTVMQGLDGDVYCQSEPGSTWFVLKIPADRTFA